MHCQGSPCTIWVLTKHPNVSPLLRKTKPQEFEGDDDLVSRDIDRELRHQWATPASATHFHNGRIDVYHILTKDFDVEAYGRLHISKRFLVGITFTNHDAFEPQGIRYVAIRLLFHYYLHLSHWPFSFSVTSRGHLRSDPGTPLGARRLGERISHEVEGQCLS
jgi:hypothetical protein